MPNHAHAHIIGHLGQDPEMRSLPDGTVVCAFSVATSRKRKEQEITTWWRCSLFGNRGEALAKYLRKGDPVLVHGEPYMRTWQDQDGNQRQTLEMRCDGFSFVGGKEGAQNQKKDIPFGEGEDIPF